MGTRDGMGMRLRLPALVLALVSLACLGGSRDPAVSTAPTHSQDRPADAEPSMTRLDDLQWKNRLVLLFSGTPSEEGPDARARASRRALEADPAALHDRKLRILDVVPDRRVLAHTSEDLRARFGVPPDWSGALLIGLDGTEKARVEGVVDPEAWFAQIDAMPMRAAELRARQADDPDAD